MLPSNRCITRLLRGSTLLRSAISNKKLEFSINAICLKNHKKNNVSNLVKSIDVTYNSDTINIEASSSDPLCKSHLLNIINKFSEKQDIQKLALQNGLPNNLFKEALISFQKYCLKTSRLPTDLHNAFSNILQEKGNITDIFPYFLKHVKEMFPQYDCLDELKVIGDLRTPANWYPEARSMKRRIIFHAGPTNSGKTYHALKRYINAKCGIYCGPLKLLAIEVSQKCNSAGTPCDLVTGEERTYAIDKDNPANHISCTVEMVNLDKKYDVAVIDEVQMIQDITRGSSWTRAILGLQAEEIHVCGEPGTLNLLQSLLATTNETVEVQNYNRLTKLIVENTALGDFKNIQKGDCIVCFNKNDIYTVTRTLEEHGTEAAVIYGSLPPGTKLAQAAKFNDLNNPCKVMVATDAIGMGLNLHIRRIIFYSLMHLVTMKDGTKEMNLISVSSALQIAGRSGRYKTQWETGYVTTFKKDDLKILKNLLSKQPEPITQAGLYPTIDQIELYAYNLPKASLSNLMDMFIELCTVDDSLYFMCNIDDFKFLADLIQDIPITLRHRYVFCCAPINRNLPFVCTMFLKFAQQFSKNEVITFDWMCQKIKWSFQKPKTVTDLAHLEEVYDILDIYLWLSYRFPDMFPDQLTVKDMQTELDQIIQKGMLQLTQLIRKNETHDNLTTENNYAIQNDQNQIIKDSEEKSLTEQLLKEGLLTPILLKELHKEWSKQQYSSSYKTQQMKGYQKRNEYKYRRQPKKPK